MINAYETTFMTAKLQQLPTRVAHGHRNGVRYLFQQAVRNSVCPVYGVDVRCEELGMPGVGS